MTSRPLIVVAQLVLAVAVVLILASLVAGTPRSGLVTLALILSVSGAGSLLVGAALVRWTRGRVGTVRLRMVLAIGIGLLIGLANVFAASTLMLLTSEDLPLFALVLAFAGAISLAFGHSVAVALMSELESLGRTAERLAGGDLSARAGRVGSGEVARLAETLDSMADRVQAAFSRERELEAGRRELLAAVSHDLRTPLATTRVMVEAITEGVVSDPHEVRHYLGVVQGELQHLARLIDDLFELSRIESGTLELQRVPTSISELFSETLAAYETQIGRLGVTIEQAVESGLRPVLADPEQLQRVLRYLVDDALHRTPTGAGVRVIARSEDRNARLTVSRSGPAGGHDDMERVFDPFYRSEPARSRAPGESAGAAGGGLSLALARGLVLAHGGRIWAERSGTDGWAFHVTIPFVAV